jgi:hypothetical protein
MEAFVLNDKRGPEPPGGSTLLSLVSAALFLYVGFFLGLSGISGNPVYDGSVAVFTWGARVLGIGLLLTTLLSAMRLPLATPVDFALALAAAVGCLTVGAIWMVFGDYQGLLVIFFGLLNASAAKSAWYAWRRAQTVPSKPQPVQPGVLRCHNPACGAGNNPEALFCQQCGQRLRADGSQ